MLTAVMGFNFAILQGRETARESYNSERAAENAGKENYEKCVSKPSVQQALECYKATEHTYAEDTRSYSDLNAQWQAAED